MSRPPFSPDVPLIRSYLHPSLPSDYDTSSSEDDAPARRPADAYRVLLKDGVLRRCTGVERAIIVALDSARGTGAKYIIRRLPKRAGHVFVHRAYVAEIRRCVAAELEKNSYDADGGMRAGGKRQRE